MKVFLKKLLVCIMLFVLLFNFVFENPVHAANVNDILGGVLEFLGSIADGIAGILTYPYKIIALIAETAILGLLGAVATTFGYVDEFGNANPNGDVVGLFGPDDIFFNRILLTDINIFNVEIGDDDDYTTIENMRGNISLWYYVMRVIAISILLGILVYIAIRMSIATIASDKAHYKKMLVDWASSIALVFLLHYVIVIVCNLNSVLVSILAKMAAVDQLDDAVTDLLGNTMAISFTASWSAIVVSAMIIIQTLTFLIYYIKRMITLSFLIIISPLITITYSIDKLGDGKAQALNAWLKEFAFTVIIQPFHCVIYLAFVSMACSAMAGQGGNFDIFGGMGVDSLVSGILAILCIKFVWDAEKIIKNIFGIKVSESLGDAVASAAVAGAVVSKGMGMAKGAAGGAKKLAVKTGLGNKISNKISNKMGGFTRLGRAEKEVADLNKQIANTTDKNELKKLKKQRKDAGIRVQDLKEKKEKRQNNLIHRSGRKIKGVVGAVGDKVGNVMGIEKGQVFKRYLAWNAGIAGAMMGGAMTYGASEKTSLFEAGLAGYGAYGGVKNKALGLMNKKSDDYIDNAKSTDAVLCNVRGDDPTQRTAADIAEDRMYATVRNENGDFKNLSDDRKKAKKELISALQDKDRKNGMSEDDIADKKDSYEKTADKAMMAIDNGIYNQNLDCDKIAKAANLDVKDLRGAVGDYAEGRICKNMATENANLDTLAGMEGYHAQVLQAYADKEIDISERSNNNETHTESSTETETQTQQTSEQQHNNNNNTQISADEIAQRLKEYIYLGGTRDKNLDALIDILGTNPNDFKSNIENLQNGNLDSLSLGKSKEVIDILEIVGDVDSTQTVKENVERIVKNISINHNIEDADIPTLTSHVNNIVKMVNLESIIEDMNSKQ